MKINPSLPGLDQSKSTGASGDRSAKGASSASAGGPQPDTIQLSALSAQLQALEATLSTGGAEFDRSKVEAIKQAIREGTLTVNPEVIADKMLASTLALLGKGS